EAELRRKARARSAGGNRKGGAFIACGCVVPDVKTCTAAVREGVAIGHTAASPPVSEVSNAHSAERPMKATCLEALLPRDANMISHCSYLCAGRRRDGVSPGVAGATKDNSP